MMYLHFQLSYFWKYAWNLHAKPFNNIQCVFCVFVVGGGGVDNKHSNELNLFYLRKTQINSFM